MRQIRSAILWFVGGTWLLFALLFMIACSYVFKPETYDPWIKTLARMLFRILGIPLTIKGQEHVSRDKTYLFMGNHVSMFDVPLFQAAIPQLARGIEAEEQFKWPIFGWAIRRAGNIPINRQNVHAAIPSANEAAKRLRQGLSMIIMPEGGRTLTGKMKPFKKLPFHLAKEGGVDLIPVGLSGLFSVKRKGRWLITPGPVQVKFGEPIPFSVIEEMSVEDLRDLVRDRIEELIDFN